MNALTEERLSAAAFLRETGKTLVRCDEEASFGVNEESERLDRIACMIERHDERVGELLAYNNRALQEARDARTELRNTNVKIDTLLAVIGDGARCVVLTPDEFEKLRAALAKNVEWHTELNDPDEGYFGSDLEEINCEAQAVLNRHV